MHEIFNRVSFKPDQGKNSGKVQLEPFLGTFCEAIFHNISYSFQVNTTVTTNFKPSLHFIQSNPLITKEINLNATYLLRTYTSLRWLSCNYGLCFIPIISTNVQGLSSVSPGEGGGGLPYKNDGGARR